MAFLDGFTQLLADLVHFDKGQNSEANTDIGQLLGSWLWWSVSHFTNLAATSIWRVGVA